MFRKPHFIALGAVLLLVLVLLSLPDTMTGRLKLAIGGLFLPLSGLFGVSHSAVAKAGDAIAPRSALLAQISHLEKESQELRIKLQQTEEISRENDRLRQQIGWARQARLQLKPGRVIRRDPSNWWRSIEINLGSRDGIRTNQPVVTPDGLVGRVSEVGPFNSQVLLMGDPNCRVAALVQETRDTGVIAPNSGTSLDPTIVDLTYLSRTSQLRPGQNIVTSGLGGIFPPGLKIGQVVDMRNVGYGLYIEARVKLAVDLSKVEEVWVLLP